MLYRGVGLYLCGEFAKVSSGVSLNLFISNLIINTYEYF